MKTIAVTIDYPFYHLLDVDDDFNVNDDKAILKLAGKEIQEAYENGTIDIDFRSGGTLVEKDIEED